jgi:Secretion system C-terminal sorting domain/Fibronectin type III domain
MKKITLLFILFAFTTGVNSQVLTQTFDTSLAPWTINALVPDTTAPPSLGWYQLATGVSPTLSPFAGAGMAQFNSYDAVSGSVYELNSPSIAFVSGSYRVRFSMYRDATYTNADKIEVYYNTVSGSTGGTLIGTVNRNFTLAPVETAIAWYTYSFNIPGTLSGAGFISFKGTGAYGNNIYVDEVNVELQPTCVNPTALVSSSITSTTATVSWTAPSVAPTNGYEYYQSTTNTAPIATTVPTGTTAAGIVTKNLTGLTPATTYYFWVRSKCTATTSSLWSPVSFLTNCSTVTTFSENFDSSLNIPACWAKVGTLGSASVQATTGTPSAPNNLYIYSGAATTRAVISMPPVSNAGSGTNRLTFKTRANFTVGGNIEVGYLTNPTDDTSFVSLQTFTTTSVTVYDNFVALLGTAPGVNQVLAFRHSGVPANSVLIDDVVWEPIPSCNNPTAIVSSSITDTTATVSWTAPSVAPGNGYEYYLATVNTTPIATTVPTGTTPAGIVTKNLTGLTPTTTYFLWVRSKCSASLSSAWSPIGTFTTPCPAIGLPYNESFEGITADNILPNCMAATNLGGINKTYFAVPTGTTYNRGPRTGAKFAAFRYAPVGNWFFSPPLNLVAGTTYKTSIWYIADGLAGFDALNLAYGNSQTAVAMTNSIATVANPVNTTYQELTGTFTPVTSGVYSVGIQATGASTVPWYISIDDFSVVNNALATSSFNNEGFSYYPNPVVDFLKLSYTQNIDKVEVMNMLGQVVLNKTINANESNIDMSSLAKGTYMVKIAADNQIKTIKVIKE